MDQSPTKEYSVKLTVSQIARMIDLSAVRAESDVAEVRALAECARKHQCMAAFALPSQTPLLVDLLADEPAIAVGGVVGGATVALALGLLRARFWWWPLHPVGYLAANCWGMHWYYMPFFIGWLGKTLVTRYGGLTLYRHTIPLAVGLISGSMINQMVWAIYHVATFGRS
jgi:hypothetical protein